MSAAPFNPAEFQATLSRVQGGVDHSAEPLQPHVDIDLRRELEADVARGRSMEQFRVVLEHYGFEWFPAEHLAPYEGGRAHEAGEWRHARRGMAFTEMDLLAQFRGPEDFDAWLKTLKLRAQLRAAKRRG